MTSNSLSRSGPAWLLPLLAATVACLVAGCEKKKIDADEPEKSAPEKAGDGPADKTPEPAAAPAGADGTDEASEAAAPAPEPINKAVRARPDADYRFVAMESLTDDPEVMKAIEALKESGDEKGKRERLEALESKGSVDALVKALAAPHPNVRSMAALLLNRMDHKSKAYTERLSAMLLSDPDADVRGMAGRVMVYYRNRGNVPALIEALEKDGTEAVRMHAAWALGASHDRRGVDALVGALDDPSTDVRLRAVGALKRIKSKKALPHLVGRLDDDNTMVKTRAWEALKHISGKDLGRSSKAWRRIYPEP